MQCHLHTHIHINPLPRKVAQVPMGPLYHIWVPLLRGGCGLEKCSTHGGSTQGGARAENTRKTTPHSNLGAALELALASAHGPWPWPIARGHGATFPPSEVSAARPVVPQGARPPSLTDAPRCKMEQGSEGRHPPTHETHRPTYRSGWVGGRTDPPGKSSRVACARAARTPGETETNPPARSPPLLSWPAVSSFYVSPSASR